jgi:hypothetical protein
MSLRGNFRQDVLAERVNRYNYNYWPREQEKFPFFVEFSINPVFSNTLNAGLQSLLTLNNQNLNTLFIGLILRSISSRYNNRRVSTAVTVNNVNSMRLADKIIGIAYDYASVWNEELRNIEAIYFRDSDSVRNQNTNLNSRENAIEQGTAQSRTDRSGQDDIKGNSITTGVVGGDVLKITNEFLDEESNLYNKEAEQGKTASQSEARNQNKATEATGATNTFFNSPQSQLPIQDLNLAVNLHEGLNGNEVVAGDDLLHVTNLTTNLSGNKTENIGNSTNAELANSSNEKMRDGNVKLDRVTTSIDTTTTNNSANQNVDNNQLKDWWDTSKTNSSHNNINDTVFDKSEKMQDNNLVLGDPTIRIDRIMRLANEIKSMNNFLNSLEKFFLQVSVDSNYVDWL